MNYTKIQHSAPYDSISPKLPSLPAAGKTVLIADASSGIGQATARAFLKAGCGRLALVSRRVALLSRLVSELEAAYPTAQIVTFAADIQDAAALGAAFTGAGDAFGPASLSVHVVVNCAGYQPTLAQVAIADLADWWRGFEVNVRGAATLARVVASHASPEAVVLQLGTAGAFFPAQLPTTLSGYAVSKLALVKLMEYFGAENPRLRVVTVHPGIIPSTEGGQRMVEQSGIAWPGDDINLPAHFLVWAASDEAKFLKNKFVFANWDVDEMKAREQELAGSAELMVSLNGFPRNVDN